MRLYPIDYAQVDLSDDAASWARKSQPRMLCEEGSAIVGVNHNTRPSARRAFHTPAAHAECQWRNERSLMNDKWLLECRDSSALQFKRAWPM
jgi:hypothetical protein